MVSWLSRTVVGLATKAQRRDLENFLSLIKPMDGDELGLSVAVATHIRHQFRLNAGWDFLEPTILLVQSPTAAFGISQSIKEHQKAGNMHSAAGLMIWLHTLRASDALELRQLGRDMWRELARGFPHVDSARAGYYNSHGVVLTIVDFDVFPTGLTPTPL